MQLEIIYLEITLLMSNLLKHANYLNAVLKSMKTRLFLDNKLPRSDACHVNSLCLALSFILTVVSTGQNSSELLFTLNLRSYYRRTETLFQKRNKEHQ